MRKLMLFVIGFCMVCAAVIYLRAFEYCAVIGCVALVCAVGCKVLRKQILRMIACVAFGIALGALWIHCFDAFYLATARNVDGETVETKISISNYSWSTDYGTCAEGAVLLDEKRFQVRIYMDEAQKLQPGDVLRGKFLLRFTASGGSKESMYHQADGIFLLAYARDDINCVQTRTPEQANPAMFMRRQISNTIDRLFPDDVCAFARALLLGDSSELTYKENTAYKVSGIRHIIAVSGLHVSILFSVAYMLAGRKRYFTAFIGIPLLFAFSAIAGFTPSVVRACVMQVLMIISMLLDREYDPPTALCAAVLLLLLANPMTITSVSFQLSVGCMIGIFLFCGRLHDWLMRGKLLEMAKGKSLRANVIRWSVNSVCVTLSAMSVTTPLCAVYFGMVSVIGVVSNLLVLWVVSSIFIGIMLSCTFGWIWLPVGKLLAWIISWMIRYVQLMAAMLSSIPFAAVYTCSIYIVVWIVFTYALLAWLMLSRKKHPLLTMSCILMTLLISIIASCVAPRLDQMRVTVLDVGQGQCILITVGERCYMVDCGGDSPIKTADLAAQTMLSQGYYSLDGLILTHYDRDHAGGVEALLTRIPAKRLFLPDITDDNGIKASMTDNYEEKIVWITDDWIVEKSELKISLFAPATVDAGNESCLSVLFQAKKCDILITGDLGATQEKKLLQRTQLPELELLVAGHHGSSSSTSFELLANTMPEAAVISVGGDNAYGLPSDKILQRLKRFGTEVYRTDRDGTIIFRR